MKILITNGTIVNEGRVENGSVVIDNDKILQVCYGSNSELLEQKYDKVIDATGGYIIAGVIDDQVHFREPGLTYKGDIKSESRAGLAGGVTSYMEMPNCKPPTTTLSLLEDKFAIAAENSYSNYSFYLGATNENWSEIASVDPKKVCGLKVFMGSSTGNMLVDSKEMLSQIFKESPLLITTHCESEEIVQANMARFKAEYGENITPSMHPIIRSAEACYRSSSQAVELATKYNARLHVLHISSAKEMSLFSAAPLTADKRITAEVCVHHLMFDDTFYAKKGNFIKWNPAIKTPEDRVSLVEALKMGKIDVVATDHAPHTLEEKSMPYLQAPSGGPLLSHSLVGMLELVERGEISVELVVEKMAHAPAKLYNVEKRGFLREGYFADIAVVQKDTLWSVEKSNILYKCGWSPFEGDSFTHRVSHTIVNGTVAYENGVINEECRGRRLSFDR
ncbi:MAG: dihydroorotase [Rikenellaceae bacterium]